MIPGVPVRYVLALIAVAFLATVSVAAQEEVSFSVAGDLVDEAYLVLESGDRSTATALAERALSIQPDHPRAMNLVATLLEDDQAATLYRVFLLESSVANGLSDAERDGAIDDLVALYLRTGRSQEARNLAEREILRRGGPDNVVLRWRALGTAPAIPTAVERGARDNIDRLEVLYTAALLADGPARRTSAFLRTLRMSYPADFDVAEMDWRRFGRTSLAALEWLESSIHGPPTDESLLRAIRHMAVYASKPAVQSDLASLYYRSGGSSPLPYARLRANGSDLVDPELRQRANAALERAFAAGDKVVVELVAEQSTDISPNTLYLDANRNGFNEARYEFDAGRIVQWALDDNEDGAVERLIVFGNGELSVHQRIDDHIYVYRYVRYPLLVELRRFDVGLADDGDDVFPPELLLEGLRWRPAEPAVVTQPVVVESREGTRRSLETAIYAAGDRFPAIGPTVRLVASGDTVRSFDRQLQNARAIDAGEIEIATNEFREEGLLR